MKNKWMVLSIIFIILSIILLIALMIQGSNPTYNIHGMEIDKKVLENSFDLVDSNTITICDDDKCIKIMKAELD